MAKETYAALQERLDVQKWVDSEAKGADTCGEYAFCSACDKTLATPCAKAYRKAEKQESAVAEEKPAKKAPAKKTTAKKK